MKKILIGGFLFLLATSFVVILFHLVGNSTIAVLQPKGMIALQERNLILLSTLLMLIIVIPVFVLTFAIAWRYRATNTKAKYLPNWEHNLAEEFIWWAVPCVIIIFLAGITWKSSHELDPFKPIASDTPTLTIQVVALDWKWLFIYPSLHIASLNFLEIPTATPIRFDVTADSPMNSFWIPQLGGQIYAMPGMRTQLHLITDEPGDYSGSSANFSGKGFSGMRFTARAVSADEFAQWVDSTRNATTTLDQYTYDVLSKPSEHDGIRYYSSIDIGLFDSTISKFMLPHADTHMNEMPTSH